MVVSSQETVTVRARAGVSAANRMHAGRIILGTRIFEVKWGTEPPSLDAIASKNGAERRGMRNSMQLTACDLWGMSYFVVGEKKDVSEEAGLETGGPEKGQARSTNGVSHPETHTG